MKTIITVIWASSVTILLTACGQRSESSKNVRPTATPPPVAARQYQSADFSPILANIPSNASREQMDQGVEQLMAAFAKSRTSDLPHIVNALSGLRAQPRVILAFAGYYERLPKAEHSQRIATLAILGELKRPDAMPFFHKIVWTPMPTREDLAEGITPRDLEEIVMVKALQGLAYLRSADADKAMVDVMLKHESPAVKIAAIDSYMWNHGDTNEAAQLLYQTLPSELHKFVERPRFYKGFDRNRFNERLAAWQQRWGTHNQ